MTGRLEAEFLNSPRSAIEQRGSGFVTLQLAVIMLLIIVGAAWAAWATVDEVTVGMGRVIPSRQLQMVQSLEGGIVREVFVREGEHVDAGSPLMRIDDTSFSSRLGEMTARRGALLAEILRLESESEGLAEMRSDPALSREAPLAVQLETSTFQARRLKLNSELSVLRQQFSQREQELIELEARRDKLEATSALLARELQLVTPLVQKGAVPEIELLRLRRQAAEMHGDLEMVRASIPRLRTSIGESQSRIDSAAAAFVAQVRDRLAIARADLSVIDESIRAARDRVDRTVVRSPVRGILNKLNVTTIGAVVQPGQILSEVVPIDDTLLIEARIRPQDVAFVRPEQPASIKITAYDYLIYGTLDGQVERIGADTITDPKGETFYQVIIRAKRNYLGTESDKLAIMPGMIARVDIQSGQKTVLEYMISPVLRVRHEALRER